MFMGNASSGKIKESVEQYFVPPCLSLHGLF